MLSFRAWLNSSSKSSGLNMSRILMLHCSINKDCFGFFNLKSNNHQESLMIIIIHLMKFLLEKSKLDQ